MKYCIIYDSQIPARSTSTWVLSFKLRMVQDSQETANNVAVSIWSHVQTFSSKVDANIFYFQSTNTVDDIDWEHLSKWTSSAFSTPLLL